MRSKPGPFTHLKNEYFSQVGDHLFLKTDLLGGGPSQSVAADGSGHSELTPPPLGAPAQARWPFSFHLHFYLRGSAGAGEGEMGSFPGSFPGGVVASRMLYCEQV